MIPKKLDHQTAKELKAILTRLNIFNQRVTIDFGKETVEIAEDEYSIDDILEAAGTLTPERAEELLEEVNWD
ncbi:hypothetical protein ACFO25_03080 [Paenactinomyces guangxiensis]|uniref:Uncharacterized protein n=1 Tax=Paenactinomyces guangxiensis TaxID=1490290 RepID=A0A7W2A9W5_9BACL|nr:hypothetical protein [Paenactinomyces guangxiensis]MBA4495664.1 hypothetical protein [Paenactinomyces guangxiensis]MBH8592652.1 hypothetical protein [Paenactinomyces guangxiensis]